MPGLIAIVGRPNVGKSALFNRLAGRRIAIVHDQPGVTRDRISAEAEWRGQPFTLVDTGGIGLRPGETAPDLLASAALEQTDLAIQAADLIVLVVDVREGLAPLDREVAQRLHRAGKPVLVAANKADTAETEEGLVDFAALGFERILPVSAIHGRGVDTLIESALAGLPQLPPPGGEAPATAPGAEPTHAPALTGPLKLAVVGRPNVGKSSLINALTRSARVIVSAIPGTTRDAVDVPFAVETDGVRQEYILIDTAGQRKPRQVANSIEFFSVKRAEDSIERCDLALLVLDAPGGILEQDKKIAGKILEARKACIVVVNKWDLVEHEATEALAQARQQRPRHPRRGAAGPAPQTLADFGSWVQRQLFFLDHAPVIFTSAQSGFHLDRLLEAVRYVTAQLRQHVPTALLNRALHEAIERRQPVSATGHRLKFFYATQVRQAPPTFLLFVNRDALFSPPYTRYLADELRRAFGFEGCPLVLVPKPRPKTVESKHRASGPRRAAKPRRPRRSPPAYAR